MGVLDAGHVSPWSGCNDHCGGISLPSTCKASTSPSLPWLSGLRWDSLSALWRCSPSCSTCARRKSARALRKRRKMQVMRQLLLEKGMMAFAGGDELGGAEANF